MKHHALQVGVIVLVFACGHVFAAPPTTPLDPDRVKAVAAMLPEQPAGVSLPISDRAAWDALAKQKAYRDVVAEAARPPVCSQIPEHPERAREIQSCMKATASSGSIIGVIGAVIGVTSPHLTIG